MASKKEVEHHLKLALEEIGEITPWFSKEFDAWIFFHNLYPVEYSGSTKEDVIQNYPKYLEEFIRHRLNNQLSPIMEKQTKGYGGKRKGAGRPKGTKEEKERVYLPKDIASWIKQPGMIANIRQMMNGYRN